MVRVVDHTGEAMFKVYARTLEELVSESVKGLFIIYFGRRRKGEGKDKAKRIRIKADGTDFEEALVSFLNEIVFMFDAKKSIAVDVKDVKIKKTKSGYKISALVEFRKIDLEKMKPQIYVKAVTRGGAKLRKTKSGWSISLIVDI